MTVKTRTVMAHELVEPPEYHYVTGRYRFALVVNGPRLPDPDADIVAGRFIRHASSEDFVADLESRLNS